MRFVLQKLENRIRELAGLRYREGRTLDRVRIVPDVKGLKEARELAPSSPVVRVGDRWGGRDRYAWFITEVEFPQSWRGRDVIGLIKFGETGGGNCSGYEAQAYLNGEPLQALDRNHAELFFPDDAVAAGRAELAVYAWSGLTAHDGRSPFDHRIDSLSVGILDEHVDDLYYTSLHMLQTVKQLDERQVERHELTAALEEAFRELDWSRPGSDAFTLRPYRRAKRCGHGLKRFRGGPARKLPPSGTAISTWPGCGACSIRAKNRDVRSRRC
ncbi:hypothetical protein VQ056_06100 [Paenibacillus sp. JTLBN-2024]